MRAVVRVVTTAWSRHSDDHAIVAETLLQPPTALAGGVLSWNPAPAALESLRNASIPPEVEPISDASTWPFLNLAARSPMDALSLSIGPITTLHSVGLACALFLARRSWSRLNSAAAPALTIALLWPGAPLLKAPFLYGA